jgi:hypothetical protein
MMLPVQRVETDSDTDVVAMSLSIIVIMFLLSVVAPSYLLVPLTLALCVHQT